MWSCVEDRIEEGEMFGRIIRKLIFEDLYADRTAVLSQNPISRNTLPHMKVSFFLIPNFSTKKSIFDENFWPILQFSSKNHLDRRPSCIFR